MRTKSLLQLCNIGFATILLLTLSGCGGGSGGTSPNAKASASTVVEALAVLDRNNTNPVLDRTTSVAGTDANNNGVRDDVDRYIDTKSDNPVQKLSLRMTSKAMSAAMTSNPSDTSAINNATNKLNMAVACIWKNYPSDIADTMVLEMRKVTVNTKERYDAYMKYSGLVSGTVIKLPKETICE